MVAFWSVHNIAITLIGYSLSYIELWGTVLYLLSVWLIVKENILTWPIGIASILLYMALFYQIQLYSDFLEQIYYLAIGFYGWWRWHSSDGDRRLTVRYISKWRSRAIVLLTFGFAIAGGAAMSRIHLWLPYFFGEPAAFPYLDALTTVMSFTAMALMAFKYIESWYYWIAVDAIGIGLYFAKDIKLIALLYIILFFMALNGLKTWKQTFKKPKRSSF